MDGVLASDSLGDEADLVVIVGVEDALPSLGVPDSGAVAVLYIHCHVDGADDIAIPEDKPSDLRRNRFGSDLQRASPVVPDNAVGHNHILHWLMPICVELMKANSGGRACSARAAATA